MPKCQHQFDVIVIGSGGAGLTAAKISARWGARVAIVERLARTGGDCTWHGCVPSKALIRCARAAAETRSSARFGVLGVDPGAVRVDWAKVKHHIRSCQEQIYSEDDSPEVLQRQGVEVFTGLSASFVDEHTLRLSPFGGTSEAPDAKGTARTITGAHFVLATGAGPALPPIAGLSGVPYVTYETVFTMQQLPARLAVVGGGPIGSELAQAFARLGSTVTLVGTMLPREDGDVRRVMKEAFQEDGISMVEGRANKVECVEGGGVRLETSAGCVDADTLLVASGRRPKGLEALSLDKAGVLWNTDRGIGVDRNLRTSAKHIYAVGDCTGGLQFTHLAGFQGAIAAFNVLLSVGMKAPPPEACPRCTFTHPEVAAVGLTEAEARGKVGAPNLRIARTELAHVDRAVCEGETAGFIKILHTPKGKILGATVVANVAGEIASELGLAIRTGATMGNIANCMHAYPSFSFALQTTASEFYTESLQQSKFVSLYQRCFGKRLQGNARRSAQGVEASSGSEESNGGGR